MTKALLVGLVAVLVGCSGGGASYETNREAAQALGDALCSRVQECGQLDEEFSACVNDVVVDICTENDCNAAPRASDDVIDECLAAIADVNCTNAEFPGVCVNIL